jgi:hypothetical protein
MKVVSIPGLPDGLFTSQKSRFGQILEGLRMKNAGIFYGHLEYFTVVWCILCSFDNVVVVWYIYPSFGKLCEEKSGNPDRYQRETGSRIRSRSLFAQDQGPILPNMIYTYLKDLLTNMCEISYKFVKNESYQIFMNNCKPNLAYFTSILQKIGSK